MKLSQPIMMISEFFTHVLRHHYQIEQGYVGEEDYSGVTGLRFVNLEADNFADAGRFELFTKNLTQAVTDLQTNADEDDPHIEFDPVSMTLFAENPKTYLDVLTALSDHYGWGLDKKLDQLIVPNDDFRLTDQFAAIAENALETPDLLNALDSPTGYVGREGLYMAVLKAKTFQLQHPARPVYSLEDIRNAFNTDEFVRQQDDTPRKNPLPMFWIH